MPRKKKAEPERKSDCLHRNRTMTWDYDDERWHAQCNNLRCQATGWIKPGETKIRWES